MTTQTEALTLALEALESDYVFEWPAMQRPERVKKKRFEAITAIKEALAQPKEQEPVAVVDVHEFYDNCANFSLLQKLPKGKHTLYTTPPQRTWVGLTNEERADCWETIPELAMRKVEAKLKEKNK